MVPKCARCTLEIHCAFLCEVDSVLYHEDCLRCSECGRLLQTPTAFVKSGQMYCKRDYYRNFSPHRCTGCGHGIGPDDIVFKLRPPHIIYHSTCLICAVCSHHKAKGDQIAIDFATGSISCVEHHEKSLLSDVSLKPALALGKGTDDRRRSKSRSTGYSEPASSYGDAVKESAFVSRLPPFSLSNSPEIKSSLQCGSTESGISQLPSTSNTTSAALLQIRKLNRRRGPRTSIKTSQLNALNEAFEATPKPTKHARAKLAMETGLSSRVIQVWFQNRRSKERRLKHLCNRLRESDRQRCLHIWGIPPSEGGLSVIPGEYFDPSHSDAAIMSGAKDNALSGGFSPINDDGKHDFTVSYGNNGQSPPDSSPPDTSSLQSETSTVLIEMLKSEDPSMDDE